MGSRYIPAACVALMLGAFGVDLATPQLLVAAILFDVPIVLSSFTGDRRFTMWLVALALVADVVAGYVNGVQDHYHWDAIGIGDRFLSAVSILLVGFLSVGTQQSALRAGELAARRRQAQRESALRRAIEAMRSSVNPEYVQRTIVREAVTALDADTATFFTTAPTGAHVAATLKFARRGEDITIDQDRPPPELLSLVARTQSEEDVLTLTRGDAFGRLILDALGADSALASSLVSRDRSFGVLVIGRRRPCAEFDAESRSAMRAFVDQAGIALSQAALFVQLAEKNEEFAAANRELAARSGVIRDIVYALSHDLRTPLSAAQMTMRQALDGAFGPLPEAYRDILRQSLLSGEELQRLAETLLLVARYESGEQSRVREPVDVAALGRSVLTEMRPVWTSKGITASVRVEPSGASALVIGDEGELRRALFNLTANAVTWTAEGGTIEIVLYVREGEIEIDVVDDGYGVPEAMRPALFGRFVASDSRRGAGSGLGLYLVRRIAEGHGGRVSYAPREPRGSVFAVRLPRAVGVSTGER